MEGNSGKEIPLLPEDEVLLDQLRQVMPQAPEEVVRAAQAAKPFVDELREIHQGELDTSDKVIDDDEGIFGSPEVGSDEVS